EGPRRAPGREERARRQKTLPHGSAAVALAHRLGSPPQVEEVAHPTAQQIEGAAVVAVERLRRRSQRLWTTHAFEEVTPAVEAVAGDIIGGAGGPGPASGARAGAPGEKGVCARAPAPAPPAGGLRCPGRGLHG